MFPRITVIQPPKVIAFETSLEFYKIFQAISLEYETCFLFESLGSFSMERYCVIGFNPKHIFSAKGKKFFIDGDEVETENPYLELEKILPQNSFGHKYRGGLFGYLGFDSMNYFEPTISLELHPDFETFKFGLYLDGLVFDKLTGQLEYFYYQENRLNEIKTAIEKFKDQKLETEITNLGLNSNFAEFEKSFASIQEEIKSGNTFQTVLSLKNKYKIEGKLQAIYEKLRQANPSPYMYYLQFGKQTLLGSSPELLLRLRNGLAETFPLAGSIKRGGDEKEDQELAKQLLNNPKEIAEHNMLVDLHRNDLGKVCEFGTVKIQKLKEITKFSHIQHISSQILGILKTDENMYSALKANFPAGTLSGAPKIETINIIDRLEKEPRGPYGGGVGYFGLSGDCDFCIAIRSLFISGNNGFTQAGAGIVLDSTAEGEYQEIQKKLMGMEKVLQEFEGEEASSLPGGKVESLVSLGI